MLSNPVFNRFGSPLVLYPCGSTSPDTEGVYFHLCGIRLLLHVSPSVLKLHYLNGVEHLPPSLRTSLELDQQKVQQWAVGRLRRAVWEIQLALRREKTQARKMEGTSLSFSLTSCVGMSSVTSWVCG